MKLDRYDGLSLAGIAGMFGAAAWAHAAIHDRIPIHFDIHGRANGWSSGLFGVLFLPVTALVVFVWLRAGERVLPKDWRERMESSPISPAVLTSIALLGALQAATLFAARHPQDSLGIPLALAISGFTVVIGLIYPRLRRNPWIGVRTAWTLSSDENWARTHRFGGLCAVAGGLIGLAFASASVELSFLASMAGMLAPVMYSFLLARRLQ